MNGGSAYHFCDIGKLKVCFSIDFIALFFEHLSIDHFKSRFIRTNVREKIFYAFRIAVIENLFPSAHGKLRQPEMTCQRGGSVACKIGIIGGKLQPGGLRNAEYSGSDGYGAGKLSPTVRKVYERLVNFTATPAGLIPAGKAVTPTGDF